ncbi:hypothetical protein PM8797T_21483 [Gimesia maris DSM 8797]|nr:hypothetical protein PM8797T_21483 [Gimesia maris DSM 8797]
MGTSAIVAQTFSSNQKNELSLYERESRIKHTSWMTAGENFSEFSQSSGRNAEGRLCLRNTGGPQFEIESGHRFKCNR